MSLVGREDVLMLENYTDSTMLKIFRFRSFFSKKSTFCGCFSVDFHVDVVYLGPMNLFELDELVQAAGRLGKLSSSKGPTGQKLGRP